MINTPASLRSDHWMLSVGISVCFQSESLSVFAGIRNQQQGEIGTGLFIVDANAAFFVKGRRVSSLPGRLTEHTRRGGHRRHCSAGL